MEKVKASDALKAASIRLGELAGTLPDSAALDGVGTLRAYLDVQAGEQEEAEVEREKADKKAVADLAKVTKKRDELAAELAELKQGKTA